MAYIIERNQRFYVVAYDGPDPRTGKERRRWHPAGRDRSDAEAIAERLSAQRRGKRERATSSLTVSTLLVEEWMPRRRRELRPSTAIRYQWMIEHYIVPLIGEFRLTSLRAEHLDRMYIDLVDHGGAEGRSLALKTVYDVHVIVRSALNFAVQRHLVDRNVATEVRPPRSTRRSRPTPNVWTAVELASFLAQTAHLRLHTALYVAAATGIRRGELAGLRWRDWNHATHAISIERTRQSIAGHSVEVPTKTDAGRRSVDLDAHTEELLARWRRRQHRDGHPTTLDDPIFTNAAGAPLHPESITQLFDRQVKRLGFRRIRFHDLRHTHASLLIANGVAIKVVSERLGHAHPGFTMDTYQHVLPGMGADAATNFRQLLESRSGQRPDHTVSSRRVAIGRRSTDPIARTPRSQLRPAVPR